MTCAFPLEVHFLRQFSHSFKTQLSLSGEKCWTHLGPQFVRGSKYHMYQSITETLNHKNRVWHDLRGLSLLYRRAIRLNSNLRKPKKNLQLNQVRFTSYNAYTEAITILRSLPEQKLKVSLITTQKPPSFVPFPAA